MTTSLRKRIIVDELRAAAAERNDMKLKVIREVINRIKIAQLKYRRVATNDMVLESLSQYLDDTLDELNYMKSLIHELTHD